MSQEQLSSDESYTLYRLPDVPTPYGTLRTTAVYRSRCDVDQARGAPPPSSSPRRDASTLTRVTCRCLQVGGPAPPARLRIEPNHQIISDYVSDSEVRQALTPPAAPIMHVR